MYNQDQVAVLQLPEYCAFDFLVVQSLQQILPYLTRPWLVLSGLDFVNRIVIKTFQTLLEVKADINQVFLTSLPLGVTKDGHFFSLKGHVR